MMLTIDTLQISADGLATKQDITDVRAEIADVRAEIADVRTEIKESQIITLKWMFAMSLTQVVLLSGLMFKLLPLASK